MANYSTIKPIGQIDQNSCWAAALSWWLKAMGKKRVQLSQMQLISEFSKYTFEEGGMSPRDFKNLVCYDARFRLSCVFIRASDLTFYSIDEPTIIIYNYPEVGGTHMNVLHGVDVGQYRVMEPYYPTSAADGKRTGKHLYRDPLHFISNSEEIGLASAAE